MSKPTIQLAPERHIQIKAIASARGLSIAETVAHFVNNEIAAGIIPAGIDGVNVHKCDNGLLINFDDEPPVLFSKEGAADLAATLREFTDEKKRAQKVANMQFNYMIERKGNGVKLTIPMSGSVTKSWPRDIARDVADLVAA